MVVVVFVIAVVVFVIAVVVDFAIHIQLLFFVDSESHGGLTTNIQTHTHTHTHIQIGNGEDTSINLCGSHGDNGDGGMVAAAQQQC